MSDRYDTMSKEDLERVMRIRGCGNKIEVFRTARAMAAYLRDLDYDHEQIERYPYG